MLDTMPRPGPTGKRVKKTVEKNSTGGISRVVKRAFGTTAGGGKADVFEVEIGGGQPTAKTCVAYPPSATLNYPPMGRRGAVGNR